MTILFLDARSDLGGAPLALLDLLPAASERGWNSVVAAPGKGEFLDRAKAQGAKVGLLPPIGGTNSRGGFKRAWGLISHARKLARRIREIIAKTQPDVIYLNAPELAPSLAWASGRKLPVVVRAHKIFERGLDGWVIGRALRRMRATVLAAGSSVEESLRGVVPVANLRNVPEGVADFGFRDAKSWTEAGTINAGIVGPIAEAKGQMDVMGAIARLSTPQEEAGSGVRVRFIFAGSPRRGDTEADAFFSRLQARASELAGELADRDSGGLVQLPVEFLGWVESSWLFSQLDLLIVPSRVPEATPRVVLEAFAVGVPVISANAGEIAELVKDGQTGFLFDAGSAESLAETIRRALEAREEQRAEIRAAARRRFEESYTLDQSVEATLAEIARLISR